MYSSRGIELSGLTLEVQDHCRNSPQPKDGFGKVALHRNFNGIWMNVSWTGGKELLLYDYTVFEYYLIMIELQWRISSLGTVYKTASRTRVSLQGCDMICLSLSIFATSREEDPLTSTGETLSAVGVLNLHKTLAVQLFRSLVSFVWSGILGRVPVQ